ncbi:MAG: hypothetical protein Q7U04_14750, partial [Bacteriovorax sp.]|nr:hypothetical protein [Bacteriovorax sp.]
RVQAAEVLAKRSAEILKKNPHMAIMALGDFNTSEENNPHPFKTVLFKDNLFTDIVLAAPKTKVPGTYYFGPKDQWNFLDHFFVNKVLMDGKELKVLLKSFEIYAPHFITHNLKKKIREGEQQNIKIVSAPKRFNPNGKTRKGIGYSDHFPILVKLEYPDKVN